MLRTGLFLAILLLSASARAATPDDALHALFQNVPEHIAPSGILIDRSLALAQLQELDGTPGAPAVSARRWFQALHEIRGAANDPEEWASALQLRTRAAESRSRTVGLAILDFDYDRIDTGRLAKGSLAGLQAADLVPGRLFAATALRPRSYGNEVRFRLEPDALLTNRRDRPVRFWLDAADGNGFRPLVPGRDFTARYSTSGARVLHLRAGYADGNTRESAISFELMALLAPAPDDTLRVVASNAYLGSAAAGDAWIYLADGHAQLTRPVLLIEGFDLDNSLNWDEIYDTLNAANMLEDIRDAGYDVVVLNFDDATDYIQRNGLLVAELVQQVQELIAPSQDFVLAGASMGALCARYALSYMEQNAIAHRVRTLLSFDGPHKGANIPIGLQYWLQFFAGQSADAQFLLSRLDRPAARQLLLYHYTDPPSGTGSADPLRADFLADLAALGDFPTQPRLVAIANGSGTQQDQGYAPGTQLIEWNYESFVLDLTGNVWAVGDATPTQVFHGLIDIILLPADVLNVTISSALPLDNAPGGFRNSLADADAAEAPYGDIIALRPAHCFVPTISALDLPTEDPFFDVASVSDPAALTPFDALYFPTANEGHVEVNAQNAEWIKQEVFEATTDSPPAPIAARSGLLPNRPNPFNPSTTIAFRLTEAGPVLIEIFDVRGQRVRTLLREDRGPGTWEVQWDGTDRLGRLVGSGIYHCRLVAGETTDTRALALVK